MRISRISQYIEVKSEKISKIYQGISPINSKISTETMMNTIHSTDWLLNIEIQIDKYE